MLVFSDLKNPFVIADVGSNWRVSNTAEDNLIMAKRHIHDAARAGVDAVKFQLFTNKELYGMDSPVPNQWSLPIEWLPELASYAGQMGVEFMCTAFSPQGYEVVDPFVNIHKIASCEMKDLKILEAVMGTGKPFLISTGGAHQSEIDMIRAFVMESFQFSSWGFLECVASYPASEEDYDLRLLRSETGYRGVSDHTKSDIVALVAVGHGAQVFEKHFSSFETGIPTELFREYATPDTPVSIGPMAMSEYVRKIRLGRKAMEAKRKHSRLSEKDIVMRHRRRLKVIAPIAMGEKLRMDVNYGSYRSITVDAEAAGPEAWKRYDGGTAKRALNPGDPVFDTTVEVQ